MQNQNLAVAVRPCTDPDRGDSHSLGNFRGQLARYGFEHNRKRARRLHGPRVAQNLLRRIRCFALHTVAAERIHRLRRQSDVPHDGDFRVRQPRNQFQATLAALDFYRLGARFLYKAHGVSQRLADVTVVGTIGHVGHDQRSRDAAPNGLRVM